MKLGFLVTARMGSTRLKNKHFQKIGESTAIDILLNRISKVSESTWIVTGNKKDNHQFENCSLLKGVKVFYGDDNNIPLRHLQLAKFADFDALISIDGDDIFCAPEAIKFIADELKLGSDLVKVSGLPLGMNAWGYSTKILESALSQTYLKKLETGWGRIFNNYPQKEIFFNVRNNEKIRATLDYPEDLEFFKACANHIPDYNNIPIAQLINNILIKKLHEINFDRSEEYWRNFNTSIGNESGIIS